MKILNRSEVENFWKNHILERKLEPKERWFERIRAMEDEIMNNATHIRTSRFDDPDAMDAIHQNEGALIDLRRNGIPRGKTDIWFPSTQRLFRRLLISA